MPANTIYGLPYPLATDPVAQGAAAIQALAEAIKQAFGNLQVITYASGMPRPAHDGDHAIIYIPGAAMGTDLDAWALARGSGTTWVFIGHVRLTKSLPGVLNVPASTQVAEPCGTLTPPVPLELSARLTFAATIQTGNVYIGDADGSWSYPVGNLQPIVSVVHPHWRPHLYLSSGYVGPAGGSVNISLRTFEMVISAVLPP